MKLILTLLTTALVALGLTGCNDAPPDRSGQTGPVAGTLEVHFIDVGQADSVLLLCGGESMLIDGGNVEDSSLVVSYLNDLGVDHLNYVVCTHAHEDHVGGLSGPLSQYTTDHVLSPVAEYGSKAFSDFLKYTEAQGLAPIPPKPDETFSLGETKITVLGPQKDYEETNNTSIVLRADFGETSFLFTGDAERGAEQDLLDAGCDLKATVLKVGHHGSDTSSSYPFIRAAEPDYAVISVGTGNSYGHPAEAVLSRLRDADVPVYRTDMQGHIVAVSDGTAVSFQVQKNADAVTNPTSGNETGTYIGNRNSQIFHRMDCASLPAEQNQVPFESRQVAVEAGYTPCGKCKP